MAVALILFVAISIIFTIKSWLVKHSWLFLMICLSLTGMLYSVMLMIAVGSTYTTFGFIGDWDKYIFHMIAQVRLGFFNTVRLFNGSVVVFVLAQFMFVRSYFIYGGVRLRRNSLQKSSVFLYVLVALFSIYYVCFYDPIMAYRFYQAVMEGQLPFTAVKAIDFINNMVLFAEIILPFVYIISHYKELVTVHKRKQTLGIMITVFSFDVLFALVYCLEIVRSFYFLAQPIDMIAFKGGIELNLEIYVVFVTTVCILMVSVLAAMFILHTAPKMGWISRFVSSVNIRKLNSNYANIFHSMKKTVFLYRIMAEKALGESEKQSKETLKKLIAQMDEYSGHISRMLSINSSIEVLLEPTHLAECAQNAVDSFAGEKDIEFSVQSDPENVYADVDSFYLTDAFENIIRNSIEAIRAKKIAGKIDVQIRAEYEWAVITISDNGIGIAKRQIKHVFKPLFTTKSLVSNCGIGLTFVYKIVKHHMGYIYIESNEGVGTDVHILLPRRF